LGRGQTTRTIKLNVCYETLHTASDHAEDYTFFYGAGNEDHQLGTDFLYIRKSYQQSEEQNLIVIGCHIILRSGWCNIIILNAHTPSKDKSDDVKDSFYEELGQVFDQFLRYY
jgi:hypothetical protein